MKAHSTLYLSIIIGIAGLFLLPLSSCLPREELYLDGRPDLVIQPFVNSPATKVDVPSVQSLQEDAVNSLNVYFYGMFQGESSPSLKHFFLTAADDKTSETAWRVSADWRAEGFITGNTYDVYVSANSRQVKPASETSGSYLHTATGQLSSASVTDLASLKSMIEFDYDPSEENGEGGHKPYWGAYDEDNLNPAWLNLHKKYTAENLSYQHRYYTNDKEFLMDGKTTYTAGSTEAIPLELVRAAAKIVVDVHFDESFLTSLATRNISLTGSPAWKFYNFSFSTPVIDPVNIAGSDPSYNKSVFTAGAIMLGSVTGVSSFSDDDLEYSSSADKHFSFATYSYPLSWTASGASSDAPAIILSLGYHDNNNNTTNYQVYKVPVVDPESGVTEIGRNKLYRIKATIASEGGELLTDAYKVRCDYDVIPWGDIPNNPEQIGQVDVYANDYFDVSPTSLTLRGDGMQRDSLHIIKPNKRNFKIKYITLPSATMEDPFHIPTTPDTTHTDYPFDGNDVAQDLPAPYFFNYQGTQRNAFLSTKTVGSVVAGTTEYLQNKFTREDKYLVVESCSLPNLADKFMMIRVYLDVADWEAKGFYRDITIRHYATTRISHKIGAWSSRISACSALDPSDPNYEAFTKAAGPYGPEEYRGVFSTEYTYDRAVYNTWEKNTTLTEVWEACSESEYNAGKAGSFPDDYKVEETSGTPSNYTSRNVETYSSYFHNNGTEIDASNKKTAHTGEANAYLQDGWYYWGNAPTTSETITRTFTSSNRNESNTENRYYTSSVDEIYGGYDYYTFSGSRSDNQGSFFNPSYTYTGTFVFYRYASRSRANNYILRTWSRKKFGHTIGTYSLNPDHVPSSSQAFRNYRWVNYDVDKTGTHTFRVSSQGNNSTSNLPFRPKYYNGSSVYYMNASNTSTGGQVVQGTEMASFNPSMYIVQSASASSSYVMGRPVMDENSLSNDQVLSPAFMIASQLGAIYATPSVNSTYNANIHGTQRVGSDFGLKIWEAKHCATYMEVGVDGTYYKNWRLPTVEEIGIIIGLQSGTIDADSSLYKVLAASYYRALNGSEVDTGERPQGNTTHTVRCVRDLTQAEIDALNK